MRTYEGDRIMETQEGKHPELKDVEIQPALQIFSSVMSGKLILIIFSVSRYTSGINHQ